MNLPEFAALCNAELLRIGLLHDPDSNREGLVCVAEPGRNPRAIRMGSEWFSAVYHAEGTLDFLRCLRFANADDKRRYLASGGFWHDLSVGCLEMKDTHDIRKCTWPGEDPTVKKGDS